ncbi:MAG: flavin reductase [Anaerolineales bacterium]|nr:flavin reductase [Anaerolineales bacterium]MDW8227474.1 flavin reductase [Anaerolineales bacterium]
MYPSNPTAPFHTGFFPQHITLVSVGENFLPIGYWTVISKNPFRFLLCMGVGNYSLMLLKKYKEAALHFMPWNERERVARAGHLSGRDVNKAETLGYTLRPAEKLKHTKLIEGADLIFETVVLRELIGLSTEFLPFVLDVVAVHGNLKPQERQPILFLSDEDFATLGEKWVYHK